MIDWLIGLWESLWSSEDPNDRMLGVADPNG